MCACAVLLAAEQDALLKAVGWDLLHTFLPFVALSPRTCAHGARQLLLRAASLCNPRELYSMVMESFVVFKVTCNPHGVPKALATWCYACFSHVVLCLLFTLCQTALPDLSHVSARRGGSSAEFSLKCRVKSCALYEQKVWSCPCALLASRTFGFKNFTFAPSLGVCVPVLQPLERTRKRFSLYSSI